MKKIDKQEVLAHENNRRDGDERLQTRSGTDELETLKPDLPPNAHTFSPLHGLSGRSELSLIHISEPTRRVDGSRMPSSA